MLLISLTILQSAFAGPFPAWSVVCDQFRRFAFTDVNGNVHSGRYDGGDEARAAMVARKRQGTLNIKEAAAVWTVCR
jgi:hypothetical protein